MLFEVLLFSVIITTGYLGPTMFRRLPPGRRLYAWMLLADLGLAIVALVGHSGDSRDRTAELLGVIAIGGGICLVFVPPLLRDFARRALVADRLRLALWMIDLRELLQPGLGARQERELVESIVSVRSGRVEEAIGVLRETRTQLENPLARRHIDERIVMTYLYARNWEQAIQHYEAHLANPPGMMSPQLAVEMVRAYCEAGALLEAAELMQLLEDSALAAEPLLQFLVNRARLMFLAFVGRTTAVEAIVAPSGPLAAMPPAAREFWAGIARLNAGDRSGARSSLTRAASLAGRDQRARELAEATLGSVDQPGVVGPHVIPPMVAELADRLTALATAVDEPGTRRRPSPKLAGVGWRSVPVTVGLVAANVAIGVAIGVLFGQSGDVGALVLAGANLKSAVAAGELWRLPASMFLHVGILHLALNMYGLWILGRLVEQMLGRQRFFAVYMTAGLVGAVASFLFGAAGLSAGASGAVFGVLGAAVAELGLHRDAYQERWRRALLGNLVFLALANVGIGFYYTAIDQAAHMGGMVAGALVGALLSRETRFSTSAAIRVVTLALTVVCAGSIAYAAFGVATTRYTDTLARYQWGSVDQGGMRWQQPQPWDEVDFAIGMEGGTVASVLEQQLAAEEEAVRTESHSTRLPQTTLIEVPAPWQAREVIILAEDGLGGTQRLRSVHFARAAQPGLVWVGLLRVPEVLASDTNPTLARILASVEQVAQPAMKAPEEAPEPAAPAPDPTELPGGGDGTE
ncbi:MAG TPA: rhomboid family intramembrane serine protease [Kofleriaceae bacterium]|nr:rhomboid family intramembrane serine protease [Kofleriaceae bacterium]